MTMQVTSNGLEYAFRPFEPKRGPEHVQAIVRTRLIDELTGLPVRGLIRLEDVTHGLVPRVSADATVGLTGRAAAQFGSTLPSTVRFRARADNYIPVAVTASLGAQPDYPDVFDPVLVPDTPMHREPVAVRGHCLRRVAGTYQPAAGVTVELVGYWPTFEERENGVAALPAHCLSLAQSLAASHAAGDEAQPVALTPLGSVKTLSRAASAGEREVAVSSATAILPGDVLGLGLGDIERAEYGLIQSVESLPTTEQTTRVTLQHPLRRSHKAGVAAQGHSLVAAGATVFLDRAAIPGDSFIFLTVPSGLAGASFVTVGTGMDREVHWANVPEATSEAGGDFSLPVIARAAVLQLRASGGDFGAPAETEFRPDYTNPVNRIEIVE